MSKIFSVKAVEILDSRSNPTLEVWCELEGGFSGKASVPSGKSTGIHEAMELRDNDNGRLKGLGVLKAVNNVNIEINDFLKNKNFNQESLDRTLSELDATKNKSRLGANAILGVSLAFARAAAVERNLELYQYLGLVGNNKIFKLPLPMLNIINGGKHAESGLDIQEFMIVPVGFKSFELKMEASEKVIASLKKILETKNYNTNLGDEGGFAPRLTSNEEALFLIEEAILGAGYTLSEIKIGIDVAASSFFREGIYNLTIDGKKQAQNTSEMISWYEQLIEKHPIISIEDGLAEDDWFGFTSMTEKLGNKIKIVGDDLTVTNVERIKMAIDKMAINSVLIKPNQIGTLSETIQAIQMTKKMGWSAFMSHRSGETMDTFIADLSVGLGCDYIKAGSLTKEERICKYNRLIEIEKILKLSDKN